MLSYIYYKFEQFIKILTQVWKKNNLSSLAINCPQWCLAFARPESILKAALLKKEGTITPNLYSQNIVFLLGLKKMFDLRLALSHFAVG